MPCKQKVYWGRGNTSTCQRNAVVDGYCRQHHPTAVERRRALTGAKERLRAAKLAAESALMNGGLALEGWARGNLDEGDLRRAAKFITDARAGHADAVALLAELGEEERCIR